LAEIVAIDAFEREFKLVLDDAYRLAYGMLRGQDRAQDAVQRAALKAWEKRRQFHCDKPFRPWFLTIVANECRADGRSRWSSVAPLADPPEPASFAEETVVDRLCLWEAIGQLEFEDQLALTLRYYLDKSFEEVGAIMQISELAARSRIHRILKRLRPYLDDGEAD
jgi:RNA polymerase sigma-70 factor, ECF subfamily